MRAVSSGEAALFHAGGDELMTSYPLVCSTLPGSIAERAGIKPGWRLQEINGSPVRDVLDYRIACTTNELQIRFVETSGLTSIHTLSKEVDQDPGIVFDTPTLDRVHRCHNHCKFCFIDQLPPGLRPSLYVKDDDYRLSFLQGSYLSLSNLNEGDIQRIIEMKLSPLYVSVQAFDKYVRTALLGYPGDKDFFAIFDRLLQGNIKLHCQIVVCPDHNDGAILAETIYQLILRRPGVLSVNLVPVGLTKFRDRLDSLRLFSRRDAGAILHAVEEWSQEARAAGFGSWIWAADEFYLLAERMDTLPETSDYEGFLHFENGVGIVRSFLHDWHGLRLPTTVEQRLVVVVTGRSGAEALKPVTEELQKLMSIEVAVIRNDFFGESITVTGLVCASDILAQLPPETCTGKTLLLPDIMLRRETLDFLDGIELSELQRIYRQAGASLCAIEANARGLYQAVFHHSRSPLRRSRSQRTPRRELG